MPGAFTMKGKSPVYMMPLIEAEKLSITRAGGSLNRWLEMSREDRAKVRQEIAGLFLECIEDVG